ncbi:MAG: tetratricopeptide repeat protein [Planctomycetota bacterium]|nr:tetratricopeptide repeat protein [Planctomycetota bacterium]
MKKDYDKSIENYTQAIRLEPTAVRFALRAGVWRNQQEHSKALADVAESIKRDLHESLAYSVAGDIWSARKEFDKALAEYTKVIEQDPKSADAYVDRGDAFLAMQEFDRAVKDYSRAVELAPGRAGFLIDRGRAYRRSGRYRDALADYACALKKDSKSARALSCQAWLLATCEKDGFRDGKRAVESATQACVLDAWRDWQGLEILAAAYAEQGNFMEAVEWQQKAIELAPLEEVEQLRSRLSLFRERKPYRDHVERRPN